MTECRIYGHDHHADLYAIVDEIDYQWALQWKWSPKWSRGGRKVYLRRVFCTSQGSIIVEGIRIRRRLQQTVFLHREILLRTGRRPASPEHTLCDHRNGDELDCRRDNLRWATHAMNAQNINQNSAAIKRRLLL